jgi:TonB-linked SusC/RagA family outer membrane protein
LVRTWTPTQKHNLSVSGGSDKVSYYFSLGLQDQEGMYKINTDQLYRYNGVARVNAKVAKWFNLDAKINYNRTSFEEPYVPEYKGSAWSIMKNDADRNLRMPVKTGPDDPIPNAYTDNFIGWYMYGARTTTQRWTTIFTVSPEFIIIPDMLKVKADFTYKPEGYDLQRRRPEHGYVTFSWNSLVHDVAEVSDNRANLSKSTTDNLMMNAWIDFNKTFLGKHTLSAVLGYSAESVSYSSLGATLETLFSPDIMNPDAAEDITRHRVTTGAQRRAGQGLLMRLNYNFADRYLLEMNGRYDGSSKFTADGRYFFFPSFSAGWRISEEPFMEFAKGYLNNLKVRGSWGKLGSQPSDYYPYQATMNSDAANYLLDGAYVTTVGVPGLVSPTLTWEKQRTINGGLDVTVLKNRLTAVLDVYERVTSDILVEGFAAYPNTLGASPPLENSGSIKSEGWELSIDWQDRFQNGLRYNVGFGLSDAVYTVINYPLNDAKSLGSLYSGATVNDIWGYETGGILQAEDLELVGNAYKFYGPYHSGLLYPGSVWYRDLNGDGIINAGASTLENPGDRKVIGNSTPRFKYNFTCGISWKGFDLNLFFQGVGKRDYWISSTTYWGSTTNGAGSKWMYEQSWKPDQTDAKFPRYLSSPSIQTAYLIDASYFRLKQAVLGYTLPQKWTQRVGVEKLRVNISGYNLFDVTDIPDLFDPDQLSDTYPQKRTIAIGAQITF